MAVRRVREKLRVEPLWRRVERNRRRLALFTAGFLVASAIAAVLTVMPTLWLLSVFALGLAGTFADGTVAEQFRVLGGAIFAHPVWFVACASALGTFAGALHLQDALSRPLRLQLHAMGAKWVEFEQMRETRSALRDMAIAAGVTDPPPDLFVLDSTGVNAFLIGRTGHQPLCVVTKALVRQFSADEQRAVFANLMSRYLAGDVQWATAVSAAMSPLWRWRDRDLYGGRSPEPVREQYTYVAGDTRGVRYLSTVFEADTDHGERATLTMLGLGPLGLGAYAVAVIVSELVMSGHRSSQLIAAEKADAEGMLLLKEPVVMLRTLRKAVEADNRVRLGVPMYAGLFYIWAGDGLADDDDPEWQRVEHLRQVLGVEGVEDREAEARRLVAESVALAEVLPPPVTRADEAVAADET